VAQRVRELLQGELTADSATEIALLNNRGLQSRYEELGVAQADLVQAGLLRNPIVSASIGFPWGPYPVENSFSVTKQFIDVFTLPLRKRIAGAQLEQAKLRVGDSVLRLAAEVRSAMATFQAEQTSIDTLRSFVEAEQLAAEFAQRQRAAGNIRDLDLAIQLDTLASARLALGRAEAEIVQDRERLARLLGVYGADTGFRVANLSQVPEEQLPLEHLETLAIRQRLDVAAARAEVDAAAQGEALERGTRWLPSLDAGVTTARDAEGVRATGPSVAVELPLFDQGQGRVARAEALLRQARAREEEIAVNARSEVRAAAARFASAKSTVDYYRKLLLPLRDRIVAESQLQYNAMQIGVFQLLLAKQQQLNASRDYVESVRAYWVARSDLELAVGGSLRTAATPVKSN
jgi:cobalt-zinc-cadmium efflux system outer membrane protein